MMVKRLKKVRKVLKILNPYIVEIVGNGYRASNQTPNNHTRARVQQSKPHLRGKSPTRIHF